MLIISFSILPLYLKKKVLLLIRVKHPWNKLASTAFPLNIRENKCMTIFIKAIIILKQKGKGETF